jgi:hypothetical protein
VFHNLRAERDQKLAGLTLRRSHLPIWSHHIATQARRLCYHRLGVMPPLRPSSSLPSSKCPTAEALLAWLLSACLSGTKPFTHLTFYRFTDGNFTNSARITRTPSWGGSFHRCNIKRWQLESYTVPDNDFDLHLTCPSSQVLTKVSEASRLTSSVHHLKTGDRNCPRLCRNLCL